MNKEYKFPYYTTLKKPDAPFRFVYMDGSTSERMDPQTFSSRWVDVVGWIPVVAEITIKPEDGKWYLCEFVNGKRSVYLYKDDCWLSHTDDTPRHTAVSLEKSIKVIAEMKEVER